MAIVYFDSSAFTKLVVDEVGTGLALALWNDCDAAVSSRLAYPEVCAALAAAERAHRLEPSEVRWARRRWDAYWTTVRPIEMTDTVCRRAGTLVADHALRGADGVHLASALTFEEAELVVAAWDRRLSAGAAAEGLQTLRVA